MKTNMTIQCHLHRYALAALMALFWVAGASAEVVTLRNGRTVSGEILLQNEEVIILRDSNGARHQYPIGEVVRIDGMGNDDSNEKESATEVRPVAKGEGREANEGEKRTTLRLELSGGMAMVPGEKAGGAFGIDVLVGSHHIGQTEILVGGMVGYHGCYMPGYQRHFLPIAAALRAPVLQQKHAPEVGLSIGYGIALSRNYRGGIWLGADLGYRYRMERGNSLYAGLFAQFQQSRETVTQVKEDAEFVGTQHRNIVGFGAKLAIGF